MLETIWFVLWALLWAVYFILDGFDLGLGSLLPFLGKNEAERRIMYNAAGPFWDGNEVWLISAGGVTFAAFPKAYAVMFSALYAPLLLLLFALIFRAVSFEFRNKVEHDSWRALWDGVHFLANLIPCVLLGVAFANLFMQKEGVDGIITEACFIIHPKPKFKRIMWLNGWPGRWTAKTAARPSAKKSTMCAAKCALLT